MKLQTSPNRWSCLPTAFAIALNVRVAFIIKYIGHDGSEIIRPELKEPDNRRGFHIQELISYAWYHGESVTPFEANPRSNIGNEEPYRIEFPGGNVNRMMQCLAGNKGVLTGQALPTGHHHAVGWDGYTGKVFNPNGSIQELKDFAINTFWCIVPRAD